MRAALERSLFGDADPVTIGRFAITGRLGSGGMGTVFSADDPDLDRKVAVKVLRSRQASGDGNTAAARLLREAKTMARLNHPNVITVHEVGMFEGRVFVAMEFVDAGTLADWMERHPVGTPKRLEGALDLAMQAARGLVAAHEAGVVHRDLKPANMLVDSRGRLRIADFGLASLDTAVGTSDTPSWPEGHGDTEEELTATGELVGTPAYMAPEQMRGETSLASDQFSFCASFFEAVYGVAAFGGRTLAARLDHIERGAITEPPTGRQPAWVWSLLVKGLAADPRDRHPDVASILRELEARQRPRRRAIGYAALAVAALGSGVVVYVAQPEARCGDGEARLAEAWSPQRRATVEASLHGSGLPFAESMAQRVVAATDAYANTWVGTYEDACTATWDRGEQSEQLLDLRMACLDRSRAALGRVTDTLASGDAEAQRKAVELVESLPELLTCSDAAMLQRTASGRSPAQTEAMQRARLLFDEGDLALDLGRFEDAQNAYARAREAVGDVDLPSTLSLVESKLAQLRLQQGKFDASAKHADEALRLASAGLDGDAAAIAHLQKSRTDLKAEDPDAVRLQLDLAEASLRRGDSPRVREAQLALLRGDLATVLGDVDTALREFDHAGALFEKISGPEAHGLSLVRSSKALALANAGRQDEALELYLATADGIARTYGEAHPARANALSGAASVHLLRGETEEALALHLQAYALLETDPGYKPQQRARICLMIADEYGRVAKFDAALEWLERAESLFVEIFGADHPNTALVNFSRASLKLDQMGDFEGAAEDWRAVIEGWKGVETRKHDAAIARLNLAISESRAGQHERAVASASQARAELSTFVDPDGQQMIGYLSSFGDVYRLAGDRAKAREAYEKAITISDAHGGGGFLIDEARFGLAQVLVEDGERERAAALAETARANFVRDGDGKQGVLNDLDAWKAGKLP